MAKRTVEFAFSCGDVVVDSDGRTWRVVWLSIDHYGQQWFYCHSDIDRGRSFRGEDLTEKS
jgi:hypothetical protein